MFGPGYGFFFPFFSLVNFHMSTSVLPFILPTSNVQPASYTDKTEFDCLVTVHWTRLVFSPNSLGKNKTAIWNTALIFYYNIQDISIPPGIIKPSNKTDLQTLCSLKKKKTTQDTYYCWLFGQEG
jgi:hypothetical protein